MKKSFLLLILLLLIIGFFIIFNQTLAYSFDQATSFYGTTAEKTGLSQTDPGLLVATVIQQVLTLVGALLIILIVYGGVTWMTAGGNEERVGKAKKTIIYSVIGVVVIIGSWSITFFISSTIENVQQQGDTEGGGPGSGQTCSEVGGICETLYSCAEKDGLILNTCMGGLLGGTGTSCTNDTECPDCGIDDICPTPETPEGSCNDFGCTGQICCGGVAAAGGPGTTGDCSACGEGSLNICDANECSSLGSNCIFYNSKCYNRGDCSQCSGVRCDSGLCVALGCTWYGNDPDHEKCE